MENTKTFNRQIMKETSQLIYNCQQALKSTMSSTQPNKTKTIASTIKEQANEILKNNTQQKEEIEKQLQVLRKKAKKYQPNCSIKQADLGQTQYTFTQIELKKLQMIDQFIERGLQIPDLDKINIHQNQVQVTQVFIPIVQNNYDKQIQRFQKWEKNGNTNIVMDQIKAYNKIKVNKLLLQNKQNKYLQPFKKDKSKFSKTINFQKHSSKFQSKSQFEKRTSIKINQFMQRNRSSNASAFNKLSPNILSQFSSKNYLSRVQRKKFPLISNSQIKFDGKKLKSLNNKQRLNKLAIDLLQKYAKYDKTTYMTDERTQGMYECQMIRKAKVLLSHKDYLNLQIGFNYNDQEKDIYQNSPKSFKRNLSIENSNSMHQTVQKQNIREIDTILSINKRRLKMERQRVITKLKC